MFISYLEPLNLCCFMRSTHLLYLVAFDNFIGGFGLVNTYLQAINYQNIPRKTICWNSCKIPVGVPLGFRRDKSMGFPVGIPPGIPDLPGIPAGIFDGIKIQDSRLVSHHESRTYRESQLGFPPGFQWDTNWESHSFILPEFRWSSTRILTYILLGLHWCSNMKLKRQLLAGIYTRIPEEKKIWDSWSGSKTIL